MSLLSPDLDLEENEKQLITSEQYTEVYKVYRKRTGASFKMAEMVIEMYMMKEPYSELEPVALLKRIRALEGR